MQHTTKDVRAILAKGPPYPKWLLDELFDDSPLQEEAGDNSRKPRIGPNYQATLPEAERNVLPTKLD